MNWETPSTHSAYSTVSQIRLPFNTLETNDLRSVSSHFLISMNIRKLLKMYITSLSVLATMFAPTAVFYDAQGSVLSFFERVAGGSANTSIKGFAF